MIATVLMPDGEHQMDIPTRWEEVSAEQSMWLASLVATERYEPQQLLIAWTARLLGFAHHGGAGDRINMWNDPKKIYTVSPADIGMITGVIDFVLTDQNRVSDGLLYAPDVDGMRRPGEVLSDITFGQYQLLGECFFSLNHTSEDERAAIVDRLCGILYRPVGSEWNPEHLEAYIREVSVRMSPAQKLAVMWYVTGSMRLLSDRFVRVFSGGGSESDPLESQMRVMEVLSDGDVTRRAAIRQANLIDVLSNLEYKIERSQQERDRQR